MTRILGIILGIVLMSGSVPVMSFAEMEISTSDSTSVASVPSFSDGIETILSSDTSTTAKTDPDKDSKKELKFDNGFYDKIQNEIKQNDLVHQCLVDAKLEQTNHKIITSSYTSTDSISSDVISDKDLENLSPQCVSMLAGKSVSSLVQDYGYYDVIIMVPKIAEHGLDAKTVAKNNKDLLVEKLINIHGVTQYYKAERLSFVTAKISVEEIPKLADSNFVGIIGDGEVLGHLALDTSRAAINAEGLIMTGKGINVAVLDSGISQNHPDFSPIPSKIPKQVLCGLLACGPTPTGYDDYDDHGTHVAGIIAGTGFLNGNFRGIAPDATLYNLFLQPGFTSSHLIRGLDWAVMNNADVLNLSSGFDHNCTNVTLRLAVDETVDEGTMVVTVTGNNGQLPPNDQLESNGCGYNVISVGNMNNNQSAPTNDDTIWKTSSKGPTNDGRLKPEITAPGVLINSPNQCVSFYSDVQCIFPNLSINGTSFAAPHVTGAAALILQQNPYYTPLEVKSAILIGATWKGTLIPSTAISYEGGIDATSLNANGFGFLNVQQSLNNATTGRNIVHDYFFGSATVSKTFTFSANQNERVKIILSWLTHPAGTVPLPISTPTANIDLIVKSSSGSEVISSQSIKQNNEWVVFNAPLVGTNTYTVEVKPISIPPLVQEEFVLASTKPLITSCPTIPSSGTWIIIGTCILTINTTIPSNVDVIVQNKSDLVVLPGVTLDINFSNSFLKVLDDSRVIVKQSGKIN